MSFVKNIFKLNYQYLLNFRPTQPLFLESVPSIRGVSNARKQLHMLL